MATLDDIQEPSIDSDKLSYEIFSILENDFLFGYKHDVILTTATEKENETVDTADMAATDDLRQAIRNQRGKICVLSIDGGGMRSILSGKALDYLENALRIKSGNGNARIADYFDVAAGTGVGGIFTAMLFGTRDNKVPIFHAEETWKFLVDGGKKFYRGTRDSSGFMKKVFKNGGGGSGGAATASLEKAMKEAFRNLTLKDTLKPVLIPCYDLTSAAPFLFSRADALESDSYDFRLWEVCRATSAEPAVFEPVLMKSINGSTRCTAVDGGLAMSNPTAAAITHVLHNKHEFPFVRGVEDILVISLGTGQLLEGSFDSQEVKNWKAKHWARPLARISSDGSADLVDHSVAMAFAQARSSNNYIRIQANGCSSGQCGINIDTDPSPKNVKLLMGIADEMMKQRYVESALFTGKRIGEQTNFEKLDWFASQLVQEHQKRSLRLGPTVAFKQSTPRTPRINQRI